MNGEGSSLLFSIGDQEPRPVAGDSEMEVAAGRTVRFDLASGGHWYGHGFNHDQPYPLEAGTISNDRFAVNNIQSPVWMCSASCAILAETNALLEVRLTPGEGGTLEISCPNDRFTLRFFQGDNLPHAQRKLATHLGWPGPAPEKSVLGDSVFCTWTQYPRCVTQERVLETAAAIREHGYPCSIITIDDRWESAYGDLGFSGDFPDPKAMIHRLHDMGFSVILWVTPFVNREASKFELLAKKEFLVGRRDGQGPALLDWWGGTAGLLDITNPEVRNWWKMRLLRLKEVVGVDGFKIDGGDAKYQPAPSESRWYGYRGPSGYADALLALFEEIAPGSCETRTAWLSQHRHIIWRQGGKDSHWGRDNGLAATVSLGLHMALMGYDVFMPDMIPGRVQTMSSDAVLPTDELFVRWTEVSAFMPIMQFSYFPWNYGAPAADIALAYARLHKELEDYLFDAAHNRETPVIRPLWHDYPEKEELYTIADEFMLGPDILVAPVLEEGAVQRDVVLPPGEWHDVWTGDTREEGVVEKHPAPCPGIPVFVRSSNRELFHYLHHHLKDFPRDAIASGTTSATYSAGIDRDLGTTG